MTLPLALASPPAKKILLVEDEFITAMNLKSDLLALGYEIPAVVDTGEEAVRQATAYRPDLVLMDITLKGAMSGIEAAAKLKAQAIPIVFLTAHADTETIARAKKTEPFGYLPKPSTTATLMSTIEMALYKSAAEKERAELAEQLRQAEKMESVGRLAGGVAHYLNSMLGVILGCADLAQDDLDPAGPVYAYLQSIIQASQRSAAIIQQLLALAQQQSIAPKLIDLNRFIEGKLGLLRQLTGESIDLRWQPAAPLALLKIDSRQIEQVLTILLTNAREAIPDQGAITIRTEKVDFTPAPEKTPIGLLPGPYLLLAVSDTGRGMDQETLTHLYEPFFTTKPLGQGVGLGLSSVYGMAKQNRGFTEVNSSRGQGTTVKLFFPLPQE